MTSWVGLVVSCVAGLILIPAMRKLSFRLGKVTQPRDDRWHKKPTPRLGGIGIFFSFLAGLLVTAWMNGNWVEIHWDLLGVAALVFLLGLLDDFKQISPPAKLIGQIVAAALAVLLGYTTNFFTPKIPGNLIAQIPNILLTFLWLVGLTNAINLIDNMDGLAGGISLITAGYLSYFFWQAGDVGLFPIASALVGSLIGFLVFNFPPASIFMGDAGSLFLGFSLALLAIARQPQASNVFAVMGVPVLLFLLPILDTSLVTITRLLRGQSPAQGGRDHTSHRLVAFGLSERQTVLVLYGVALISGAVAITIETLDYWLSLALIPLLVLSLALFSAYLGRLKVVVSETGSHVGAFSRIVVELTYRRRTFEIVLDFIVVAFALYLAFWTDLGLSMNEGRLQLYLRSLPVAIVGTYISFILFGVYRGMWRYVGVDELIRYAKATTGSVVLTAIGVTFIDAGAQISPVIWILYMVYFFLGIAASRSSFRILDQIYGHQSRPKEQRVLIIGASDEGEMALRWILMNPHFGYRPVGFLDNDPFNAGREIHGVGILGGFEQLEGLLSQKQIDGVVLTTDERISGELIGEVIATCRVNGRWVRSLKLEFELLE